MLSKGKDTWKNKEDLCPKPTRGTHSAATKIATEKNILSKPRKEVLYQGKTSGSLFKEMECGWGALFSGMTVFTRSRKIVETESIGG